MTIEITEDTFLKDVSSHEMKVLHDEGVYRHLRFKTPLTWDMHFDLVTWPGHLAYSGDMGCYVFSRIDDMFKLFRTDRKDWGIVINLGYWSQKLQAVACCMQKGSAKEFDEKKFNRAVITYLARWMRDNAHITRKDERRDLWEAVIDEVVETDDSQDGDRRQVSIHDFKHFVNNKVGKFSFQDFFENDFEEFTFSFVWCCYALAWGITKYDEAQKQTQGELT